MSPIFLAVDAGTSLAKSVAFAADGSVLAAARQPMPPLRHEGRAVTQSLAACVEAVERAREAAAESGERPGILALTTQRDTLVLCDDRGDPLTDLISWRDTRELEHGTLWDALATKSSELLSRVRRIRSLNSYLTERWVGLAVETPSTLPRHLVGRPAERLAELCAEGVDLPRVAPLGSEAGALPGGTGLFVTAGDKNCELLGAGVVSAGRAGVSLGSAISLATAVGGARPELPPGGVLTTGAVDGLWNVETGLIVGMLAERLWRSLLGERLKISAALLPSLWCVPSFAGTLDCPTLPGALVGLTEATTAADVYQAWAQGVVGEVRRLRPILEVATGQPLREVVVTGGGAVIAAPAWISLLANGLGLPVARPTGDWAGARGAVLTVLLARNLPASDAFSAASRNYVWFHPEPGGLASAERYYSVYEELVTALAGVYGEQR